MNILNKTTEPVLVVHEIASVLAGGGTAAAALEVNVSPVVKAVAPFAVAAGVRWLGWLNRAYVSPAWNRARSYAARHGVDLPSEGDLAKEAVALFNADGTEVAAAAPTGDTAAA